MQLRNSPDYYRWLLVINVRALIGIYRRFPVLELAGFFAAVLFLALPLFLAPLFDLGGRDNPYLNALLTHELNLLRSLRRVGGTTTYSRIGRPGMGSKILAPLVFSNSGRESSGRRRSMSS